MRVALNMDKLLYLLSILLVTCCGQEDFSSLRDSHFSHFHSDLSGCKHEIEVKSLKCVSKAYCNKVLNLGWVSNSFRNTGYNCSNTFTYYKEIVGDTYYAFINIENLETLRNTYAAEIITSLDLSYNNFKSAPVIPPMQRLKTLKISRTDLITAKLYNENSVGPLSEIDLSHNKITSIIVNQEQRVFKQLKSINLSNNRLVSIEDRIFNSFSELENLDLSFNYINNLSILTFDGLTNLLYLNLKDNELNDFSLSLIRFSELKELDLSFNKISNVKSADFEKNINLEILNLNSNAITNVDENAFDKMSKLQILNLSNNLLQNLPNVTWDYLNKLVNVDFSDNDLKYLPSNLFKDKQIVKFSISGNKLEGSLAMHMFEGLKLDDCFDLSNQNLISVQDFAFSGLENLKKILLNNNKLQLISKKSFYSLQSLELLDLSNNQLSNIDFDKGDLKNLERLLLQNNFLITIYHKTFYGLNSLRFLDISKNNISILESSSFMSLKNLTNLQISNNPLSGVLHKSIFEGLYSLPSLDISGTTLTAIENGSFIGMNHMKEFNASHGKISELQYDSFLNTGLIEVLDLSYNELNSFDINVSGLENLNTLILNNNFINELSCQFLKSTSHLKKIIISYNQLEVIDELSFENKKSLTHLDLAYNKKLKLNMMIIFKKVPSLNSVLLSGTYTNISFESKVKIMHLEMSHSNIFNVSNIMLQNVENLSELNLSYNNITKVDRSTFQKVDKLTKLDLSHNKITVIQPGAFKDNTLLQDLNISYNMITVLSYGIFKGLSELNILDMSYNEVSVLEDERFYELRKLRVLIVDHNKIKNILTDEFLGTNLVTLSVGENPIPCQVFVNLKKVNTSFTLTALKLEESSDNENVDGITCNMDRSEPVNPKHDNPVQNDNVMLNIRDILHNISNTINVNKGEITNNSMPSTINAEVSKNTSLLLQSISATNENTNIILDKILQALSTRSKQTDLIPQKTDINTKDSKGTSLSNSYPMNYTKDNFEYGSSVFYKVGVGLTVVLIILVLFISYMLYSLDKTQKRQRLCSTRLLSNIAMDNSIL